MQEIRQDRTKWNKVVSAYPWGKEAWRYEHQWRSGKYFTKLLTYATTSLLKILQRPSLLLIRQGDGNRVITVITYNIILTRTIPLERFYRELNISRHADRKAASFIDHSARACLVLSRSRTTSPERFRWRNHVNGSNWTEVSRFSSSWRNIRRHYHLSLFMTHYLS